MRVAVSKIFRYTDQMGYDDFASQEMVQDAVIKNFEILGEAAYHLSKPLQQKYPDIAWRKIAGLRHILVHDYYRVNPQILWNTKEKDLPQLVVELDAILGQEQ